MAEASTSRGVTMYATDGLEGLNTALKYIIYQTEQRGDGDAVPDPCKWIDAVSHFRSALAKEAEFSMVLAGMLRSWADCHPEMPAEDLALVREATRKLTSIERSLQTSARNMGQVRAFLDTIGSE